MVSGTTWSVQIGQCPSFIKRHMDSLSSVCLVWVYIAAVVAACLLIAGSIVGAVLWHEKDVALRVALAKHEERSVSPAFARDDFVYDCIPKRATIPFFLRVCRW